MLKIFDNYYLDASSVCYMLKKAHVKGDGKLEYDVCTYHTRLEEALAEAVRFSKLPSGNPPIRTGIRW